MNSIAQIEPDQKIGETIESIEATLLRHPGADIEGKATCELLHHFGPGVYVRELRRPADTFILGHAHKTAHLNVVVSGDLAVMMHGKVRQYKAGDVFMSEANSRKLTYTQHGATLLTIHPTHETDLDKLEDELITKSEAFESFRIDEANALKLS